MENEGHVMTKQVSRWRFRVTCSYDGTDYDGWQSQAPGGTVQDEFESHFERVLLLRGSPWWRNRCNLAAAATAGCSPETRVRVIGSGRTDAGVHASAQVFHADLPWPPPVALARRARRDKARRRTASVAPQPKATPVAAAPANCNDVTAAQIQAEVDHWVLETLRKNLPLALALLAMRVVGRVHVPTASGSEPAPALVPVLAVPSAARHRPRLFHARESCVRKRYVYTVVEGRASPFEARFVHQLPTVSLAGKDGSMHTRLDVGAMRVAAARLLGRHDFRAYSMYDPATDPRSPVRELTRLDVGVERRCGEEGTCLRRITITAECDRFLHRMVRMLAGTLIEVGLGRVAADAVLAPIKGLDKARGQAAGDPRAAGRDIRVVSAPASGLRLERAFYAGEGEGGAGVCELCGITDTNKLRCRNHRCRAVAALIMAAMMVVGRMHTCK